RFGRVMRLSWRHRVERLRWLDSSRFRRRQQAIRLQQIGQRQQPEAAAGFLQKVAAIRELLVASAMMVHMETRVQYPSTPRRCPANAAVRSAEFIRITVSI